MQSSRGEEIGDLDLLMEVLCQDEDIPASIAIAASLLARQTSRHHSPIMQGKSQKAKGKGERLEGELVLMVGF